jgi:hypothetical protein
LTASARSRSCRSRERCPGGQIAKLADRGVCPALFAKIFSFSAAANHFTLRRYPALTRGAFRDRHGRWERDAMDAACQKTNDIARGRRSRVVLTSRRWRQVRGIHFADDGGKKARSPGRARSKLLKPLRGECRATRRDRGDLLACFLLLHEGCGRIGRPAFPAPSESRGREVQAKTRAKHAARSRICI